MSLDSTLNTRSNIRNKTIRLWQTQIYIMELYGRFLPVYKFYLLHISMFAMRLLFLNELNYGMYKKIELFFYRKRKEKQTMSKSIEEHPRKALFFWNRYTGKFLGRKIRFTRKFYFSSFSQIQMLWFVVI